jgi:hypothetical protein
MSSKSSRFFGMVYIKPRLMPAVRAYIGIPRKKPPLIGTCVLQLPPNSSVMDGDITSYLTKLRPSIEDETEVWEKYDQYDQIYLKMKPDKTVTEEFLKRICRESGYEGKI